MVGDDFVWDGGYPRWAEAGGIVVLYPQAVAWTPALDATGWSGNPRGCWDWWGYGGDGYADHRGGQMRAVRAMIGRLLRSEEHTSELQSLMRISYAVFCLKKKKKPNHV